MGRKLGLCPFGDLGPHVTVSPGPTSTSLSSGILTHPAVWPQQTRTQNGGGGGVPLLKGELGPHVTQCGLGRRLYPSTEWYLDPCSRLATTRGTVPPPPWGRAEFPSNTMSPGPRSTSLPSDILIHPTVWPQQTWAWAKNWGLYPLWGWLGPHLTQCGLDRGLPPCQVSS